MASKLNQIDEAIAWDRLSLEKKEKKMKEAPLEVLVNHKETLFGRIFSARRNYKNSQ